MQVSTEGARRLGRCGLEAERSGHLYAGSTVVSSHARHVRCALQSLTQLRERGSSGEAGGGPVQPASQRALSRSGEQITPISEESRRAGKRASLCLLVRGDDGGANRGGGESHVIKRRTQKRPSLVPMRASGDQRKLHVQAHNRNIAEQCTNRTALAACPECAPNFGHMRSLTGGIHAQRSVKSTPGAISQAGAALAVSSRQRVAHLQNWPTYSVEPVVASITTTNTHVAFATISARRSADKVGGP